MKMNLEGVPLLIDGSKYWSRSFSDTDSNAKYLNISVLSTEPDSLKFLNKLVEILGLTTDELLWMNKDIGPASWILTRIDDNGNETEMFRFQEESSANWILKKYEEKRHKRHYYVNKVT